MSFYKNLVFALIIVFSGFLIFLSFQKIQMKNFFNPPTGFGIQPTFEKDGDTLKLSFLYLSTSDKVLFLINNIPYNVKELSKSSNNKRNYQTEDSILIYNGQHLRPGDSISDKKDFHYYNNFFIKATDNLKIRNSGFIKVFRYQDLNFDSIVFLKKPILLITGDRNYSYEKLKSSRFIYRLLPKIIVILGIIYLLLYLKSRK